MTEIFDIVGAGRVGGALHARAVARGLDVRLIGRDSPAEAFERPLGTPCIVATRNDDLDAVLARVPAARHDDLVFVQNGMLRPWLLEQGIANPTRGLLFFAVPRRGVDLTPGPDPSPFTGPLARSVVAALTTLDVPVRAVHERGFREIELNKLIWNAAFGLLGDALDAPVGVICTHHRARLFTLVDELRQVGERGLEVTLDQEALMQSLCAYSATIADYRASVKEWAWRNGWFVQVASEHGLAMPHHEATARELGLP